MNRMKPFTTPYADRREAGRQLAQLLTAYENRPNVLILAISPGAVVVADGLSEVLGDPVDVFCTRPVLVPGYEEVAMGTVARGAFLPDTRAMNDARISMTSFVASATAEQEKVDRLEAFYRNGRLAPSVTGRTVILVDDGFGDGSKLKAAVGALHHFGVGEVIVAVPVAPAGSQKAFGKQVDGFVCPFELDAASSLERWYLDDADIDDETARAVLQSAAERSAAQSATPPPRVLIREKEPL